MADLPPNIGFDDEPVILLNYVTLEDSAPSSRPLIMSKSRNRVKSDSSLVSSSGTAGKKRSNKSSVSSLSDASSLDPNESDKMNTPLHSTQSQESDVSPCHLIQSKSSPLKRLQEEKRNCLTSLDEVDSVGRRVPPDSDKERGRRKKGFSVVVEPRRSPSTDGMNALLIERDKEISELRRQLKELQTAHQSSDVPLISISHVPVHQRCISETSEPSFILGESLGGSQRSTLERLLEEQQVSYRLKTDNSELRSKVLILEGEVDSLRQQNLVQLQQLEQATTSLAAASNSHSPSSSSPQKTKKKSFFGLRRSSGRKSNLGNKNGSGSSIEQSPRLKRPGFHSASNLSLEGSLSEHDISSLLTRKSEGRTDELHPLGDANFDFERLQMTLKLTMEEKSELGRQLELLREELRHQEEKREELLKDTIKKDKYMESSVKLQETLQALQLTTREKELLQSEGEGLKYELETLRSERDSLTVSLKGKEVKAVLKEKQEMDFLRSENKALMSEVRTLISNSDGLETSLSQLKREMVTRDVRGHELKLKIKKLEKENAGLKVMVSSQKEVKDDDKSKDDKGTHNLLSARRHASPEKQTFTSSSSSFSDQQSPSTGQPAMKPHHRKPSPFLTASTGKSKFSAHERTQSEDLTSSGASVPPLQMVRTSSGGTKFVAVQVTLPTKENATKVKDKSSSVPVLEEPTNNQTKRKTSDSTLGTFVSVTSSGGTGSNGKPGVNSLVKMFESGKGEGERGGRGSLMSGSLMESSLEESIEEKEIERESRSDSVSSKKPSLKKTRKLSSSSSLKEEQERTKKMEEEEARQAKKREDERKKQEIEAKKREEAREKQRKEEEARERAKREQEARERERREEQLRKEEMQQKELEAKEKERREKERKEREQEERKRRERERKEEEERQRKEKEKKEQERREKEEQQRKRDEITADRSQTWPPKAENVATTGTNTLPLTSSHRTDPKSPVSPVHSSPLIINKPKPPPTIMGVAGRSKTHSVLLSPTQTADSSLTGVVANLRSSWEKKSQMGVAPTPPTSHPRLSKAPSVPVSSVPVSYPRMERTSSLNAPAPPSAHLAPPPFTKTGSGPAGTIISSPSNPNKTTLGLKRVGHASSEATLNNPAHTQNGHVTMRSKSPIDRTSSTDATGEVVLRSNVSPRLNRPASLYVSSTSQSPPISFSTPTSEKRLSSLITKLQVKDTTTTPTATPTSSFVQNQSPILQPRNVGVANNNKNVPPPMTRPHSFYAGSSPKPLQRAASLASPLDRRTKKNMLIRWCQIKTQEYHNVNISNFGESFSNGLAFCALLHHFVPEKIPYHSLDGVDQKRNFELAFTVAEELGIPSLLDVDDMVEMAIPDWMSVMTYVSYIYNHFSKKEQQS